MKQKLDEKRERGRMKQVLDERVRIKQAFDEKRGRIKQVLDEKREVG